MNKITFFLIVLAIVICLASLFIISWDDYGEMETITVGNGVDLKVGIITDMHFKSFEGEEADAQAELIKEALMYYKENQVDVLINCGDFFDYATVFAYETYAGVYDEVFGTEKPIASFAMGNHDYWLPSLFKTGGDLPLTYRMRDRFKKYTGEKPFTHKVVNGYHFIAWSVETGIIPIAYINRKWIEGAIEKAIADDPNRPVFVATHFAPKDTVYGSDEWGSGFLTKIFKKYPQVVVFSGHSHYSLLDERSIYQGDFTAINAGSVAYIELESGKENGSIPTDAYGDKSLAKANPMGLIMSITDNVEIKRVDYLRSEAVKEPWILDMPFTEESFRYTEEKQTKGRSAPYFNEQTTATISEDTDIKGEGIRILTFNAAQHEDFVHSYRINFKDEFGNLVIIKTPNNKKGSKTDLLYFSDFFAGLERMSDLVSLQLPANLPDSIHSVVIYATESWGKESEGFEYVLLD